MTPPTYNDLLIELVATLDAVIENSTSEFVKELAKERRKYLIELPGQKEGVINKLLKQME